MRTTLNLSEDALHVAKHHAMHHELSLGDAVSALIRAGASVVGGGVAAWTLRLATRARRSDQAARLE